jgi:energy-coupling factor transporter ATP-binding protein EcfA2/5S rRNA maturation endonuclease (ribonuclease M5)
MAIKNLNICGLRGFATQQQVDFALPNGQPGSGFTVLVGPNNGGKSTVIEAIRALSLNAEQSFTVGKRNQKAGDKVHISLIGENNDSWELRTVASGGSECNLIKNGDPHPPNSIFVLPSRRFFNPLFGKGAHTREQHIRSSGSPTIRSAALDQFSHRLFQIQGNREEFNKVLQKVLTPVPNWTIDQSDGGQYFLKYDIGGSYHNSDGLGEGLISLFFIIDALYDSKPGNVIVIDEPELSLHPSFQRRLSSLLIEYSADRQIIIATHSPYFVDFSAITNGARIARVYSKNYESQIAMLGDSSVEKIEGFLRNLNNPHVIGLDAREVFFLDDGVILVEGQEDVVVYNKIMKEKNITTKGHFFGWGVGGAHNMEAITEILKDLGFEKVVGILDADKREVKKLLSKKYPNYSFFNISANDVRTKPAKSARAPVEGLIDEWGNLKNEYSEEIFNMITNINGYFETNA